MNLLLLATGFAPQYRVLRCASEFGATVYVAGSPRARSLAISRYCKSFHVIPDVEREWGQNAAQIVGAMAKSLGVDLVLPSDSITTRFLCGFGDSLGAPFFPVPTLEAFDSLDTKDRFAALCSQLAAPHPAARTFESVPALSRAFHAGELTLPAMAKPLNRSGGIGVMKLTAAKFAEALRDIDYAPILLQDYVEGTDFDVSLYCRGGVVLRELAFSRARGTYRFFANESAFVIARQLVATLGYTGVINIDMRESPDGAIHMIECNPRFWYSTDVALAAGVNMVALGIADATGRASAPPTVLAPSVHTLRGCALAALQGRLSTADWRLIACWVKDPIVLLLELLAFQKKWFSRTLERALSWRAYRGVWRSERSTTKTLSRLAPSREPPSVVR